MTGRCRRRRNAPPHRCRCARNRGRRDTAALGLAVLLRSAPVALMVVELVGGLYPGWLAVTTIRSARKAPAAATGKPARRQVLRRAVLTSLLNPKMVLFFTAFLPRFTSPEHGPLWLQFLTLGMILLVPGLAWDSTISCAPAGWDRGWWPVAVRPWR
ncbi:LysE family translocator [Streptomyces sp. RKAG290]|uniref:LysE family translocator n=1 Tax=Streptomyces sp. RKAG290 TaxID=2888348 RepID=UPI0035A8AA1D